MVRNYVRKTQRGKWSEENMKKAIDDIKNKKLSIRQAAEQHGVPKSTLERHWKGRVVHPGKVNLGKYKQALNSDLEEELVEHVKKMQEMFFGLTGETLRALAFQLANANGIPVPFNINNQKAGKDWLGMQRSGDYAPSDQFSAEREGVASMQRGGDSTTSDQAAAEGLGGILLSDGPSTSVQIAVQSEVQPTDGPSTRVHVMDISPLPDAKLTTRKRKAMKSQVLTSSLFKKILLSKSKVPSSNKPIHKRNKKQL